jgi:GNAT superfamily N-acetyltransferase
MVLIKYDRAQLSPPSAIAERSELSNRSRCTRHYVAFEAGRAVAFVSLDIHHRLQWLVLYELFVPREYRGRGIGTCALSVVERFGRKLGYAKLTLRPHPLDIEYPFSKLKSWYRRLGYEARGDSADDLEKVIGPGRDQCPLPQFRY